MTIQVGSGKLLLSSPAQLFVVPSPAKPTVSEYPTIIEVEVNLRPTVSRPVHLGIRHSSGTADQFFILLEIFFKTFAGLLFCSALSDEATGL
jgi:hypothetical protein